MTQAEARQRAREMNDEWATFLEMCRLTVIAAPDPLSGGSDTPERWALFIAYRT